MQRRWVCYLGENWSVAVTKNKRYSVGAGKKKKEKKEAARILIWPSGINSHQTMYNGFSIHNSFKHFPRCSCSDTIIHSILAGVIMWQTFTALV